MLDAADLGQLIAERFTHTAFRLETLPAYEVATDRNSGGDVSDFDRYLAGEAEPLLDRKAPWLDVLAAERRGLKYRYRVRILGGPNGTTPYERYSAEWGYAYNVRAGEGVFVLDRSERPVPPPVLQHDYWLLDDEVAIRMHYEVDGQFAGATMEPNMLDAYRASRDAAMAAAVPFAAWWARHPEQRRANVARAA
jgi:hypothetical protein